ncbi:MAG: glycerophosphodiester phosphodiesterase, partial [Chloroflexi bacterium]|nr:glycerophosphodiester phosphodiesterase [Chloroflexota bacterium]
FMNIAHRGASSYAPENTFAAYDKALDMGVTHIELDVHFTKDGHIVVIHDDTVDRTTSGKGPVAEHTLAELRSLDAGSWFALQYAGERIRSLGEILEHYKGRLYFHIEIKARVEGLASRTADMVRGYGLTDSVTITSFWKPALEETRAYAPELPTGWLVPPGPRPWDDSYPAQAKELGLTQVCPRADLVTSEMVDRLHKQGFVVRAWGIADEELMRRVVDAGADGMTINFPDKLVEYLKKKGM